MIRVLCNEYKNHYMLYMLVIKMSNLWGEGAEKLIKRMMPREMFPRHLKKTIMRNNTKKA